MGITEGSIVQLSVLSVAKLPLLTPYQRVSAYIDRLKQPGAAQPTLADIAVIENLLVEMHNGCEEVRKLVDDLTKETAKLRANIKGIEFTREFTRVRLALRDLNGEYLLEKELRIAGKYPVAVELEKFREAGTVHFILEGDSPKIKAEKTKYAIEHLENLSEDIKLKLGKRYHPELLSAVLDRLHCLPANDVEISKEVREDGDDWWSGLLD